MLSGFPISATSVTLPTEEVGPVNARLHAASLISFYLMRYSKKVGKKRTKTTVSMKMTSAEKKRRKTLFFQISYYPNVKKLLSFLLMTALRRRYLRIRRSVVYLQSSWRRKLASLNSEEIGVDERSESDDSISVFDTFCPSPSVFLRGSLLTTPMRGHRLTSNDTITLRRAPNVSTPVCTKTKTTEFLKAKLQTEGNTVAASAPPPSSAPVRGARRVAVNAPKANNPTVFDKPPSAPVHLRVLTDEMETLRITQQNTINNSGYKTSELVFEDEIRPYSRPSSPSNKFAKDNGMKRKWADIDQARSISQKEWEDFLAKLSPSPQPRKIGWHRKLSFIDDDDLGGGNVKVSLESVPPRGILRSSLYSNSPDSPTSRSSGKSSTGKSRIAVKRIKYVSPIKKGKKSK